MLNLAELVQKSLYATVMAFAETMLSFNADQNGRKADPNDKKKLIEHLGTERIYWSKLENDFSTLVIDLPHKREAAILQWKTAIRLDARTAFEESITLAGESINALKAATAARRFLEYGIHNHLEIKTNH